MTSRSSKQRPSFRQQNLPAWQPLLTAGTVLPTFFLIGVAFVPIGVGLLMSSTNVQEKIIPYTDCMSTQDPNKQCASLISDRKEPNKNCTCEVDFELEEDFRSILYVYYGLTNFYQNHRRYVKSRDDYQLLGNPKSVSSDCGEFTFAKDAEGVLRPIAPCGAIANSIFNDAFELRYNIDNQTNKLVGFKRYDIAWATDKRIRFQNPKVNASQGLKAAFEGTVKPPNWSKPVYELAPGNPDNNGFQNEDLIVWMRTAALPTFRKLWAIVKTDSLQENLDHLPKGRYTLKIHYNYPVKDFHGEKRFIISNTSWLGGKNNFLGLAYIVVGCICLLLSGFFLYIHKKYARTPSEITQINRTTPY